MGLGDGTRMDGTSSLDEPTGTRKYSMSAPSAGDRAAKRERKTNDLVDRNLQRAMRTGTPQQRVAAGVAYQERSSRPGYQQGGGVQSAEGNKNRDRKTADNFTEEGLRLEGKENPADVVAGQADAANKGVGVATADGGTNSKIGTSAADAMKKPASGALGNGSGSSAENARESLAEGSTGGSWTNVGPSATDPAATPSAPPAGPANDMPAADDWKQQRATALDDKKKQFAIEKFGKDITDWTVNDPEDQGKKSAQIFEYGKSLGISPEQIEAQADKARNGQVADAKEKSKYQATDAQKAEGAADDFGKAYGAYLNGAGKTASKEEKDAKYAELKGTAVKNGFVVTKEAKDKAAWTSYEAKVKAAKDAGIDPNTITSETNFGEEAKALVPGAKKEVQNFIDAAEIMKGSTQDAFGDFEAAAQNLKERRGAPAFSQDQMQSVVDGSDIRGLGQQELDPVIPSGNPLFDNPSGPSNSWGQTASKPSSTKEVGGQSASPATPQSDENPILQDLADAGSVWNDRWKRDAAAVSGQFKTEGEAAKTFTKVVGGGLLLSAGSLVGGRTGEQLKEKADAFDQMIDTLTTRRKGSSRLVDSNNRPL